MYICTILFYDKEMPDGFFLGLQHNGWDNRFHVIVKSVYEPLPIILHLWIE